MKVQIDTNILTRLAQPIHPQFGIALAAVQQLESAGHTICIVPQNLFEFWTVATRPLGDNGLGLAVPEAKVEFDKLKKSFVLLVDSPALLEVWEELIVTHECKGKPSHDARIVAAMHINGIDQLLTFNAKDFIRFTDITILAPATVADGKKS